MPIIILHILQSLFNVYIIYNVYLKLFSTNGDAEISWDEVLRAYVGIVSFCFSALIYLLIQLSLVWKHPLMRRQASSDLRRMLICGRHGAWERGGEVRPEASPSDAAATVKNVNGNALVTQEAGDVHFRELARY